MPAFPLMQPRWPVECRSHLHCHMTRAVQTPTVEATAAKVQSRVHQFKWKWFIDPTSFTLGLDFTWGDTLNKSRHRWVFKGDSCLILKRGMADCEERGTRAGREVSVQGTSLFGCDSFVCLCADEWGWLWVAPRITSDVCQCVHLPFQIQEHSPDGHEGFIHWPTLLLWVRTAT